MKQFFRKILNPMGVKEEEMNEIWSKRPKTIRILVEFENGIKKELVGEDAETYAKSLFWIQNGWRSQWTNIAKLTWHRTH